MLVHYLLNIFVVLSNIIANEPLPSTLQVVIIGSNNIYNAVTIPNISGDICKYSCIIGNITNTPPPGTAATENFASTNSKANNK